MEPQQKKLVEEKTELENIARKNKYDGMVNRNIADERGSFHVKS